MLILIPKGSNVAYINNVTLRHRHEKELLIDKGQLYLLVDIVEIFNKKAYIVKLISKSKLIVNKERKMVEKKEEIYSMLINGKEFATFEKPYVVLDDEIEQGNTFGKFTIKVREDLKEHGVLYYTTDVTALEFILKKKTLRSSSLTNAKLNDKLEKQRVGISQFAGSRFITCFSNLNHENIHFWYSYGGEKREEKILLKIQNFSDKIEDVLHLDYCLIENDKKVFFENHEYYKTINQNGIIGATLGLPQINTDYNLQTCISSLELFDVEYLNRNDADLTRDYSGKADLNLDRIKGTTGASTIKDVDVYDPRCLGRQKSIEWEIEHESRIMLCLKQSEFDCWEFIDLRLKDEMFRNMEIVLSPWLSEHLGDKVEDIIKESTINDEIKSTIKIVHSSLEGEI